VDPNCVKPKENLKFRVSQDSIKRAYPPATKKPHKVVEGERNGGDIKTKVQVE